MYAYLPAIHIQNLLCCLGFLLILVGGSHISNAMNQVQTHKCKMKAAMVKQQPMVEATPTELKAKT